MPAFNTNAYPTYTVLGAVPAAQQGCSPKYGLKTWAGDPALMPTPDEDGNVSYPTLPAPGGTHLVLAKCPAEIWAKVNMPGAVALPVYRIDPTEATIDMTVVTGGKASIPFPNAAFLSTAQQANDLAAELTAVSSPSDPPWVVQEWNTTNGGSDGFPITFGDDARRYYLVTHGPGGYRLCVGEWLAAVNAQGVGWPITITINPATGEPAFTFDALHTTIGAGPAYPVPVQPIPAAHNLRWFQFPFLPNWMAEYVPAS